MKAGADINQATTKVRVCETFEESWIDFQCLPIHTMLIEVTYLVQNLKIC